MTDAIVHRGPDEEGFYSDGRMNLGIRRLSIIDLETGHQPVHNEDKSLWTVFNGEIYNFQELRRDLMERGHTFYTDHSDTEVIVHLYEEYGDELSRSNERNVRHCLMGFAKGQIASDKRPDGSQAAFLYLFKRSSHFRI